MLKNYIYNPLIVWHKTLMIQKQILAQQNGVKKKTELYTHNQIVHW